MTYSYNLFKTAAIILLVDLFWLGTAGIYARHMAERIQGSPIQFRIADAIS